MTRGPALIVKHGREKSLLRRHPWVFSGAIAAVEGAPQSGETVRIRAADGKFLAHAAYSPKSQIVARVWDWNESQRVDEDFFRARISTALRLRASLRMV